jgi:hypothetical protein
MFWGKSLKFKYPPESEDLIVRSWKEMFEGGLADPGVVTNVHSCRCAVQRYAERGLQFA